MATNVRLERSAALISANPRAACHVIDRGPNWLFIRAPRGRLLGHGRQQPTLSEEIWQLADRYLIYRIILHVEQVEGFDVSAVAQILELQQSLEASHGSLRLCGLRPDCGRQLLRDMHCDTLHNYATAHDAVQGFPCHDEPTYFDKTDEIASDCQPESIPSQRNRSHGRSVIRGKKTLPR